MRSRTTSFGDHQVDDDVEGRLGGDGRQRLGLADRAGEAVEDPAPLGVGLVEPVVDDADHDVVGDEVAGVHDLLGPRPSGGALAHRGPEHVAGGDVGHAAAAGQALRPGCPCPRPGARGSTAARQGARACRSTLRGSRLQEALVVAHHQLAVDLLHRLEGDAHGDEDRDAEEAELEAGVGAERAAEDERRDEGDEADEQGAREGDAVQDAARYRSVCGPGRMPGMKPPCLRIWSACLCGSNWIAV